MAAKGKMTRKAANRTGNTSRGARAAGRGKSRSVLPVAITISRYNDTVTGALLEGALAEARAAKVETEVFEAAGAFELVGTSSAAAASGRFAGVLAIGCIIRGETKHDEFLAHAVTSGLASINIQTGCPVSLGVLTVNDQAQALDRAGGKHGNKGAEAMVALLHMISVVEAIRTGRPGPSAGERPDKLRS